MGRRYLNKDIDKYLKSIYYDLDYSCALSSLQKLYHQSKKDKKKISLKIIKIWLMQQDAYTLHKNFSTKGLYNKTLVSCIDDTWQIDLVDMNNIKKYNKNYKYLLTCIDIFSRFGMAQPIKNKQSGSVLKAFKIILKKSKRNPRRIQSDGGKEFINTHFQGFLKNKKIHFYSTINDTKASIVERFHRTLKSKMWKYFTSKNTYSYINILYKLIDNYNNSYHRSIKMTPNKVTKLNKSQVFNNLYNSPKSKIDNAKFSIGDKVRILRQKHIFEKGHIYNWSKEIFTISEVVLTRKPVVYKLLDLNNEIITGTFYSNQLQKIIKNDEIYHIEKIIQKKQKNKEIFYLIKWLGYPKDFNSWVKKTDILKI